MRLRLVLVALALALAAPVAAAAPPFKAVLKAGTPTPTVNKKWWWELRVTDLVGKPIRGRLTLEILDPLGGVHPVEFGDTTRTIVNFSFVGRFRDFVRFPPESRGFALTVRWTVKAKGKRIVLKRTVTPAR